MTEELNFKSICSLATRIMGIPDGSLSEKSRERHLQVTRSIAGYIALTEEEINRNVIARVLKRNRTATYHYQNKHKKNFKHCIIYRTAFEKIYKAYKDIDGAKNVFVDSDFMKSHLLQNGVAEVLNPDVLLEVKSGEVKCIIKTSYFEFSNQLEIIKFVLENYHYTIKII